MAKRKQHSFWKRLRFKYKLSAVNENTLEEIWNIKASLFSGISLLILFAMFLIGVTSFIIIKTPIKYYLPGYLDSEIREQMMRSAILSDSLEQQVKYINNYAANVRDVLTGKVSVDSMSNAIDTISISENDPSLKKGVAERDFVQKYSEDEKYNLSVLPPTAGDARDNVLFFKPVKGVISRPYNPAQGQYDIEIGISGQETVSAILEGRVIYTGYDIKNANIVQIQHKNGFVSVYQHLTSLLKETGDEVKTGEAIAVIDGAKATNEGNSSSLVIGLWYKGNPVNPTDYIFF